MKGHLDVALATADIAPVFPCRERDEGSGDNLRKAKSPRTRNGLHDATCDPDRIRGWWTSHPAHIVGLRTERMLVVDLDVAPNDPMASWRSWLTLADPHGWTAWDCPMVATPSDGLHIFFITEEKNIRNSAGKIAPHVDIRASGGYVIAPGSVLADGRRYELLDNGLGLGDAPQAPAWLVELCTRQEPTPISVGVRPEDHGGSRYGTRALDAELGRLAVASVGTRNDTLHVAACRLAQLVAGGELDAHLVHDRLLEVALRIGLDHRESEQTIASGMRKGARAPRKAS